MAFKVAWKITLSRVLLGSLEEHASCSSQNLKLLNGIPKGTLLNQNGRNSLQEPSRALSKKP